jgi:hypothetical protein
LLKELEAVRGDEFFKLVSLVKTKIALSVGHEVLYL